MPGDIRLILFFFFNDTATTEIYTLSLHDALPICSSSSCSSRRGTRSNNDSPLIFLCSRSTPYNSPSRSEEHTSELQSQSNLVCRLLLEKKKKNNHKHNLLYRKRCSISQLTM